MVLSASCLRLICILSAPVGVQILSLTCCVRSELSMHDAASVSINGNMSSRHGVSIRLLSLADFSVDRLLCQSNSSKFAKGGVHQPQHLRSGPETKNGSPMFHLTYSRCVIAMKTFEDRGEGCKSHRTSWNTLRRGMHISSSLLVFKTGTDIEHRTSYPLMQSSCFLWDETHRMRTCAQTQTFDCDAEFMQLAVGCAHARKHRLVTCAVGLAHGFRVLAQAQSQQ